MKMITGFLAPTRGTARVMGHDVRLEPLEVKRKLGYLPESAPSYGEMTVLEFLTFIAKMRELSGEKGRAAIARAVELCHLGSVRNQSIETLSKGYRQRVGFAQAILHDPPILILDEPTDGLDPNQKHEVRRIIRSMAQDKAVILSTHILEEVEAMCTRVIIIAGGKLLVDETPAKLLARKPGARMEEIFRDLTLPNQVEPERAVA
jgi:ABC-2 type transport system ATP-binding protein